MQAGPHTDYGSLTILRAENKPGGELEVHTPQGDMGARTDPARARCWPI